MCAKSPDVGQQKYVSGLKLQMLAVVEVICAL